MKSLRTIFRITLFFLGVFLFCPYPSISIDKMQTNVFEIPPNAVKGDFNGDGNQEYMWLEKNEIIGDGKCDGACICYILFSNPDIPIIIKDMCIGGLPRNLGDLNQNGADEIGLLPGWFWSFWRLYYVWTFIEGEWVQAVDPIPTHDEQWHNGIFPISRNYKKDGYVIIHYSESAGKVRTKTVKIKRECAY